jgi:hypothetical protein
MELRVRKAGELDFTKDTKKYGMEAFADETGKALAYICETGSIAVNPGGTGGGAMPKAPEWKHAMELSVRKAGESKFTKDTKKFGVEVFRDENNGNLIYICETGNYAVVPNGTPGATPNAKAPDWKHGMEVSVRKAGEKDFNKDTKKYGIEVFLDTNNGNLVYISETGSIAVVSGVNTMGEKAPDWTHGMELAVRKAGEQEFTAMTKKYGVEVFRDANNGNLIYIADTGNIAVLAGNKNTAPAKTVSPEWKYAMDLGCRKAGEAQFTKDTKKWGVEVFHDANLNVAVCISETGSLAIAPGK